jgi:hypothetical protein
MPTLAVATYAPDWVATGFTLTAAATASGVLAYMLLLSLFILGSAPGSLSAPVGAERRLRGAVAVSLLATVLAGFHGAVKAAVVPALVSQLQSGAVGLIALSGVGMIGLSALLGPVASGATTLIERARSSETAERHPRALRAMLDLAAVGVLVLLFHVLYATTTLSAASRTLVMGGWFALAAAAYGASLGRRIAAGIGELRGRRHSMSRAGSGRPGSGGAS